MLSVVWLDRTWDGTPGSVVKVLAKAQLVVHCNAMVAELPAGHKSRAGLMKSLKKFSSYEEYSVACRYVPSDLEDPLIKLERPCAAPVWPWSTFFSMSSATNTKKTCVTS